MPKEPIIVVFFILQYAELTVLQLKYNFFFIFCDENKYKLIEMVTDSLYMALSEEELDIINKRTQGLFKEEFGCTEMIALFSKIYCCYDGQSDTVKLSGKGSTKKTSRNP